MYCKNCGKQLSETDRFCPYCGADQQSAGSQVPPQQPAGGQVPPQQPVYDAPSSGGSQGAYEMILKIFSILCAVIFLLRSLSTGFSSLRSLFYVFRFFYFPNVLNAVLLILSALAGLWMVLVLVLTALRRTPENTGALTFGVAAGGALVLVLQVVRLLFALIFYQYFNSSLLTSMLGVIICVAGVYALLYLMGQAPTPESLLQDPAGKLSAIFGTAGDSVKEAQAKQAANAAAKAQAEAAAAANGANNGYAAPNGGYTAPNNGYAAPNGYAANGAYTPVQTVKTDRSLLMYIVLSIITCGIYSWYFIYSLARDVNVMCRDDGQKTGGLLAFILLSIITCGFYALYWEYSLGNRLASNAPRYGLNFQENGTTVLLWYLVGMFLCGIGPYVAMHILIKNSNALGVAYNRSVGF